MTPINRALLILVGCMGLALVLLARQQVEGAPNAVTQAPDAAMDTQDIMGTETLLAVTQEAQIETLQQELTNVELTSRSVGLLTLKPGQWRNGWMATFYTGQAGLNGTGTMVTKSGNPLATDWTCAADPKLLPLGTIIEVKFADGSQRILQVTDTGGAIQGRRLDVYVPNQQECMKLGRQRVQIRVLRWG